MQKASLFVSVFLLWAAGQLPAQRFSEWDAYLTEVGEFTALISLDLSLKRDPFKGAHTWLGIYSVEVDSADSSGFPTESVRLELDSLESVLEQRLDTVAKVLFAGRATYHFRRQFFFYCTDTLPVAKVFRETAKSLTDFRSGYAFRTDPSWSVYKDFLYPRPREFNAMLNQRTLEQLARAGDPLDRPRPIDHWVYFSDKNMRLKFAEKLWSSDFEMLGRDSVPEFGNKPFQLHFRRTDLPTPSRINALTWQLRNLAEDYGGEYDGWEAELLRSAAKEQD